MRIEVVTLFPEMIRQAMEFGITGRAVKRGLLAVGTEDPRTHTHDVHRTVDDRPYGGGPGMVMKPEPLVAAIAAATARVPAGSRRIYLSPQGERLTQRRVEVLAKEPGLVLVAGRYEGIDERVIATSIDEELSVGDYVLSGGELPALVVIDAVATVDGGRIERRAFRRRGEFLRKVFWTGRTTPGRWTTRDSRCPRCCRAVTTSAYGAGGSARHWEEHGGEGRTCSSRAGRAPQRKSNC